MTDRAGTAPRKPVSRTPRRRARTRWRIWPLPAGVALFLFLASLFVLTSGGHTYSYDEETMFALTQSLIERGTFEIPACTDCGVLRSDPAPGGRNYSRYGVLLSLLAVPFYLVGRTLAGEHEPARWVLTRLFATLIDPLATAATAALVYGALRAIGYRVRVAIATALLYALGTQAWVYAKTFFAESLTTLFLFSAVYTWLRLDLLPADRARQARWWSGAMALSCGLAVATKWAAALAVPIVGVAAGATLVRKWRVDGWPRGALIGAVLTAAAALALPVGGALLYNFARFGNPLTTGYGAAEVAALQSGDFGDAFRSLLLSPGKGLFLFSPAVLLAIPWWWEFAHRHLRLALLAAALVVAHLLFYARVPYWHGDVSWGPRYLTYVVPLLALPAAEGFAWLGTVARPARRWVLIGAGVLVVVPLVVVQVPGVAVNFDTGFAAVTTGRRYWDWANSPPYVQAKILEARVAEWREVVAPTRDGVMPGAGFDVVNEFEPLWPRFLPARAELNARASGSAAVTGTLDYQDARAKRDPPQRIVVTVNGRAVPVSAEAAIVNGPYPSAYRVTFPLRAAGETETNFTIAIRDENFAVLGSLRLLDISVANGAATLPVFRRPLLVPFPANDIERFSWFMAARNQHLVDLWPWYLAVLQLPRQVTARVAVLVGGGSLLGLAIGLVALRAAWRGAEPRPPR